VRIAAGRQVLTLLGLLAPKVPYERRKRRKLNDGDKVSYLPLKRFRPSRALLLGPSDPAPHSTAYGDLRYGSRLAFIETAGLARVE